MFWFTILILQQFRLVYLLDIINECNDKGCLNPYLGSLGKITHNKCGKSPALRRIWKLDLLSCVKECKMTSGCFSVSYRRQWKLCDLNTDTNENDLVIESGCVFTLMSTWLGVVVESCGELHCEKGHTCVVSWGQPACELAYCVGEPEVENADVVEQFGLYKNLGLVVRYECHSSMALRGLPLAYCQPNGAWHTNFSCYLEECSSNPCQNGGSCHDGVNEYTCTCRPGYSGDNCQTDVEECISNPCQNNGSCNDGVNSFSCTCKPGYGGNFCQRISISTDREANQSSTYHRYKASYGVDGLNETFFHTGFQKNPRWWVDLGQSYTVDLIVLRNRVTCCGYRLANLTVYVGNQTNTDEMEQCAIFEGPGITAQVIPLQCENNPVGNIVLLSMMHDRKPLHLSEVEVYSTDVYDYSID